MEQVRRILLTVAGLLKTKSDGKPASARADLMAFLIAKNMAQLSRSGDSPISCNTGQQQADSSISYINNKKAQLSLTNLRDACKKFARFACKKFARFT